MAKANPETRARVHYLCAACARKLPCPPARIVITAVATFSVCPRCQSVRFESLDAPSGGEPPKNTEGAAGA